jgi:nitroreductase
LETGQQENDIRLRLLQFARLAPNSHNVQPWLVDLSSDNTMRLYVDRGRLLPASDPPARQIHISQGTFLELLEIAARDFGYRAEIRYFPDGEYSSGVVEDRPVASISLRPEPGVARDSLFQEVRNRRTNKRPYDLGAKLSAAELAELHSVARSETLTWRITTAESERRTLCDICTQAMATEVSSADRNRETARWFRFSDRELLEKRDGFGAAQNGVEGVKKWFAENFILSRERAADPKGAFAQGAVAQAREQAGSAPVLAALVSRTNTRLEQVLAGRAYARMDLTASRLGLAIQPLSQALEEYPEMASLHKRLKLLLGVAEEETVQMLFRLGRAEPARHTPRRTVASLIRQGAAGGNGINSSS